MQSLWSSPHRVSKGRLQGCKEMASFSHPFLPLCFHLKRMKSAALVPKSFQLVFSQREGSKVLVKGVSFLDSQSSEECCCGTS